MSVLSVTSNNQRVFTSLYPEKDLSVDYSPNQSTMDAFPVPVDKYTKSQENIDTPTTYNADGRLPVNPREGGRYDSLIITSNALEGMFVPGGPNDDREMTLLLGQIYIGEDATNHPYQAEYDEYNAIFREIYTDVLTERGLMPQSGDLHEVKIKVGEIHKVYDEVMARVSADKRASELASNLGIVYAEVLSDAELRKNGGRSPEIELAKTAEI